MKNNLLFIPAAIRSHIEPALYIADRVSNEYFIHFAVTSEALRDIVVKNGFIPVANSKYRVCVGMEAEYLREKGAKASKLNILGTLISDRIFRNRKEELDRIIRDIYPKVIIIDVFNSFDFFILYAYHKTIKVLFYNPMLSTYKIENYPTVRDANWSGAPQLKFKIQHATLKKLQQVVRSPINSLVAYYTATQRSRMFSRVKIPNRYKIDDANSLIIAFENVPEIVLAPQELELSPAIRKSNQHYLGLCIKENRFDTDVDAESEGINEMIRNRKGQGNKLVYCSFGTYHQGSLKSILYFMNTLLDAIAEIPNVFLICSIHKLLIETMRFRRVIPANVYLYTKVKQLDVLRHADMHITHGGLSSIKESIYFKVPMLVYPLDLRFDQNGNGLKIEHHGLGLRGLLAQEKRDELRQKIKMILNFSAYRAKVSSFNDEVATKYSPDACKSNLLEIFSSEW